MNLEKIKINGKTYPVLFGMSQVKTFAIKKGLKTVQDFEKWLSELDNGSFENIEGIASLLLTGIERGCKKSNQVCDLDTDDLIDLSAQNPEKLTELMTIFTNSMNSGDVGKPDGDGSTKKK